MTQKYKEITVYSQSNCSDCKDADDLLTGWGVPFTLIDIRESIVNWDLFTGLQVTSVPQIVVDGKCVGTFHELVRSSTLSALLESGDDELFQTGEIAKESEMSRWVEKELDLLYKVDSAEDPCTSCQA